MSSGPLPGNLLVKSVVRIVDRDTQSPKAASRGWVDSAFRNQGRVPLYGELSMASRVRPMAAVLLGINSKRTRAEGWQLSPQVRLTTTGYLEGLLSRADTLIGNRCESSRRGLA